MHAQITKKDIRWAVERLSNRPIYSTANLKSTGEYRMSIPWHGGYRNARFKDVDPAVWQECNDRKDRLVRGLEDMYPRLQGNITSAYHIGSGIYLSLRVKNAVLGKPA